jgi:hypothetical protein
MPREALAKEMLEVGKDGRGGMKTLGTIPSLSQLTLPPDDLPGILGRGHDDGCLPAKRKLGDVYAVPRRPSTIRYSARCRGSA